MNLKRIFSVAVYSLICTSLFSQVSFGQAEKINSEWKFNLGDTQDGKDITLDDMHWNAVDLPHDWSIKGQLSPTLASSTGYLPGGIGWYRKKINVPKSKEGEKVYLYFEGVYNRSEVYVNGQLLGKRPNGYVSFLYDATPYIKYGQDNTIAVRVDHSQSADSRWYTGSGIYRDVWLVYANPLHIAQWGIFAYPKSASQKQATLAIEIELDNSIIKNANLQITNELSSADGKVIAKSNHKFKLTSEHNKLTTELKVNNPQLWDLQKPHLYQLKTVIYKNGEIIDKAITTTGLRDYTFDPEKGFALNGEWMKLKGVCIHHDAGVLGSAVPKEVWRRRLLKLKEIGINAIRTSHNPQAPDLYNLCDQIGLLVLNEAFDEWEFPKRKWLEGWNIGTPGFEGSFDFFAEWGEKDLADIVRRDRNNVSVFAWSIGNEVDYPNDPYSHPVLDGGGNTGFTQAQFGGYKKDAPDAMRLGEIAKRLVAIVKKYDKSRPTTAGLAGVAMSNETGYPGVLDITGYNYTESRYITDHQKYPERVIYGSENRHDMNAWKSVKNNEHISGQFLWTGIDYLGESGRWPSRGFYSGLLDFGGFIKPRGYFRKSLWTDTPMTYIGTYPTPGRGVQVHKKDVLSQFDNENNDNLVERTPSMDAWPIWNYTPGQSVRVVCYTNAAKARLLLDNKEVGATKSYDENTGIIYWDIPYQPGALRVVGLDLNNNEVSTYTIQTSQQPAALRIIEGERTISKDKGLAQIILQVVDKNGVPVMLSDNEVTCRIIGPGKLLGLEAGNNEDMSDYTDNRQRVFHGHILAYIQATGQEGEIKIQFTSPWINSADILINAE